MIATSGATQGDSSSSSTKGNKANIGTRKFRTVKVIRRNYGAACPRCFEKRNQSYRTPGDQCRTVLGSLSSKARPSSFGNCRCSSAYFRRSVLSLQSRGFQASWRCCCQTFHRSAACKFCELDPAPTWIIKKYANELSPFIVKLFNTSLTSGVFPTSQKCASVTPALKKVTLDPFDLGNYRPISNLKFVSKLLEHAAHEQIVGYASENQLLPDTQSAYQKPRSTETAILKVLSDVYEAADSDKLTLLGLLDLSAAFDTVDHQIILSRLQARSVRGGGGRAPLRFAWPHAFLYPRAFVHAWPPPMDRAGPCCKIVTLRGWSVAAFVRYFWNSAWLDSVLYTSLDALSSYDSTVSHPRR